MSEEILSSCPSCAKTLIALDLPKGRFWVHKSPNDEGACMGAQLAKAVGRHPASSVRQNTRPLPDNVVDMDEFRKRKKKK
jgi:hypothetical protein